MRHLLLLARLAPPGPPEITGLLDQPALQVRQLLALQAPQATPERVVRPDPQALLRLLLAPLGPPGRRAQMAPLGLQVPTQLLLAPLGPPGRRA